MIHQWRSHAQILPSSAITDIEVKSQRNFNPKLSTNKQLRFGRKGSFCVCAKDQTWYDHEQGEGGHLASLLKLKTPIRTKPLANQAPEHKPDIALILKKANPCSSSHPYIIRKKISNKGFLSDSYGNLLIPKYRNNESSPCNIEFRAADNSKTWQVKGAPSKGCYFRLISDKPGYITVSEGIADAVSLHQATNLTSYCAFSATNLIAVCTFIRSQTSLPILVAADNDKAGLTFAIKCLHKTPRTIVWKTPCACCNDASDFFITHSPYALQQQIIGAIDYAKCY